MRSLVSALVTAIIFSTMLCGCIIYIQDGTNAGSTQYKHGELQSTLDASLLKSLASVKYATQKLKFTIQSEKTDALSAQVHVLTAQDKKIKVKLNKVTDITTRITIKVGAFGDQSLSYKLLEEIQIHSDAVPE